MKIKYLGEGNEAVLLKVGLVSLTKGAILDVEEKDAEFLLKDNSRYATEELVADEDVKTKSKSRRI